MDSLTGSDKVLVIVNHLLHKQGKKLRNGRINDIAKKATSQAVKKLMKSLNSKQLKMVQSRLVKHQGKGLKLSGESGGGGLKLAGESKYGRGKFKIPTHILKMANSSPQKIIEAVKAIDKHGKRALEMAHTRVLGKGQSDLINWMMKNPGMIPRVVKVASKAIIKGKGGGKFQPASVTGSIHPAGAGCSRRRGRGRPRQVL